MKIQTLSGHLTATNKIHIRCMFEAKVNRAKVNRINYDIIPKNGFYSVTVAQKDNSVIIGEKINKSKATFKIL